ncbi:hypothetical protein G7Y89_g11581 [Cudoniella acicularis]|uniref:Hydrophobin n=1 Tax=Cudoniella acicularis TaxID=354080 RepID=A0A8H4RCY8_9HELO|nr:hypothetical protein G7Y89_g11581 [Cudoniella acicularis]
MQLLTLSTLATLLLAALTTATPGVPFPLQPKSPAAFPFSLESRSPSPETEIACGTTCCGDGENCFGSGRRVGVARCVVLMGMWGVGIVVVLDDDDDDVYLGGELA